MCNFKCIKVWLQSLVLLSNVITQWIHVMALTLHLPKADPDVLFFFFLLPSTISRVLNCWQKLPDDACDTGKISTLYSYEKLFNVDLHSCIWYEQVPSLLQDRLYSAESNSEHLHSVAILNHVEDDLSVQPPQPRNQLTKQDAQSRAVGTFCSCFGTVNFQTVLQ